MKPCIEKFNAGFSNGEKAGIIFLEKLTSI
jgi:hypothetical protein